MTPEEFAVEFKRFAKDVEQKLGEKGQVALRSARRVKAIAELMTPVGPVRQSKQYPRHMSDSWQVTLSPEGARVFNNAPHAIVINKGRRRGKHRRKGGGTRMQGSSQARHGITRPIRKIVDDIIAEEVERKLRELT